MMAKKSTEIDAHKHPSAKRVNIPTSENQSFVTAEEAAPKPLLYPRDPELDPQLVWRGKDAQDREGLNTVAVPIYIQEKMHPQAIIDDLKRRSDQAREEAEEREADFVPDLFAQDFGGVDPEDAYAFYAHEHEAEKRPDWANRMILGDSLLVMASLAEKEAMRGSVQCIYLDPPYGIKFNSNWQPSTKSRDVTDGKPDSLTREPEMVRAFRDTWNDGIHSYLSYLRDRLVLARDLLADSGSIFVQIGDENVHVVRSLMDEIFGAENFISEIIYQKTGDQPSEFIGNVNDICIWYAKFKENLKYNQIVRSKTDTASADRDYKRTDEGGRRFQLTSLTSNRPPGNFPVAFQGRKIVPNKGFWKTGEIGFQRIIKANRVRKSGESIRYFRLLEDYSVQNINNVWTDTIVAGFSSNKIYVVETLELVVQRCILMTTDPGDLVLDPTCGSGTTAFVAEQWGRRWITIDTSRVALALARQRLMAGRFPAYLLHDTVEGMEKEAEITRRPPDPDRLAAAQKASHKPRIRQGFVLERVPHITLKSIANNAEIDTIWEDHEQTLAPLLDALNEAKDEAWEEWEVPRDPADPWPEKAIKEHAKAAKAIAAEKNPGAPLKALNAALSRDYDARTLPEKPQDPWTDPKAIRLHGEWWAARRARQEEIDASIARNADTEYLVDKPYEAKNRVRVTGPFTVESLSPHRVLPTDDEADAQTYEDITGEDAPTRTKSRRREAEARAEADFVTVVLENLRASGVQNTKKGERLTFTELRPHAGDPLIAAEGRYMEGETERRAAVLIGPEYGTVGFSLVRDAARKAADFFDTLIVCGFAFAPDVNEERLGRFGGLTVLKAAMNNDLHMAGALKPTGAGNLFTVFGEPQVAISKQGDRLVAEIVGVDVFDPTTGEVRSSDVNDIACWFVDTDYDAESFFVRHVYFLGGHKAGTKDHPYKRLETTLKADIDPEAWETLYSAVSRPFDPPANGRIAVKVINHYGDEVLKVYEEGEDW